MVEDNNFDIGFTVGRFFGSWIINDLFCGLSIRLGKDVPCDVYYILFQIGYGQLTIGWNATKGN